MATITFKMWQYNNNYGGQHWNSWDVTIVSDAFAWMALAQIPDPVWGSVELNVDGEQRTPKKVYVVGAKPAVDPPSPVYVRTPDFIEGAEASFYGFDTYSNMNVPGYVGANSSVGSTCCGLYDLTNVYDFASMEDLETALANGEIVPIEQTVYLDVYINGTDKPSIAANWTAGEDLGTAITPKVWIGCQQAQIVIIPDDITQEGGLSVPDTSKWFVDSAGNFSYGGSYSSTYLSIQQHFEQYLNPANKFIIWGLDGDPDYIRLYFQIINDAPGQGHAGIGDLVRLIINKDGTASYTFVEDSQDTPGFYTVVRLHLQEEPDYVLPDEDPDYPHGSNIDGDGHGKYDPDNIPDPDDFTTPIGFDGNNVLTTTYAVSAATLQNIGQKLWSQDYFNVLKIQNNPMENIVAVKYFPFAQTGTNKEVKIGDVAFGINGIEVPSVYTKVIGHYKHTGHFKSFLDYAPYTSVKLFLPYIGWIQLDPADIMGCELYVTYYIDLVTGQCMARLRLDENQDGKAMPFMTCFGNMGVDIPLSASDRVQTEIRAISSGVSALGGLQGHLIQGPAGFGGAIGSVAQGALNIAGMDYTSQRTSNQSPVCSTFDCQDVYIMVERPAEEYVEPQADTGYKHLHGYPTNKYMTLSSIPSGKFVQVDLRTDLQIAATGEENAALEKLLTEGVYV